jgi:hypothetical protein
MNSNAKKKSLLSGIINKEKEGEIPKSPSNPSAKATPEAKPEKRGFFSRKSSKSMEPSADAGNNNNNAVDTDKAVVNSDGQALAKSGAAFAASEKKIVSGTTTPGPATSAPIINNNPIQTQKSNLSLKQSKPETPDIEEGYTLGSGLPQGPQPNVVKGADFHPQREKSAAPARWGGPRVSGSPGSDDSRPMSPMDNYSEMHGGPSRPKSRTDMQGGSGVGIGYPNARYSVSNFWKARRVLFYRNGDPFFPAVEFRFKPGRDISTLDKLLDKISQRMDLPRGARYIFSMDGDRKTSLDELEDGSSYVVSSFKQFKVKLFA